jgi:hypothetical protein
MDDGAVRFINLFAQSHDSIILLEISPPPRDVCNGLKKKKKRQEGKES